jgi:hypothetical protein
MLPLPQWLLCVWQARTVGAPWWSVLAIILCMAALEFAASEHLPARAWADMVRACISLVMTMHVAILLYADVWALSPILLGLAAWALCMPEPPSLPADLLAWGLCLWSVCAGPLLLKAEEEALVGVVGWIHLVLLLHMLLLSNRPNERWRWAFALSVCLVVGTVPEQRLDSQSPWLLLSLPSLGMHARRLVTGSIVPIIETLCHPGLYPLQATPLHFFIMRGQ